MRKNTKHKEFIKQLKERNTCKLTPMDIYSNTDFFDNPPVKKQQPYKFAFLTSLVVVAVSIALISILSIQNYKLLNKEPEIIYLDNIQYMIDDSHGMTYDEKIKIKNKLSYFNFNPIAMYSHDKNIVMYLYYGYKTNEKQELIHHYYYAFNLTIYAKDIKIYINNEIITASYQNKSGLLKIVDENKNDKLVFSFTVETEKSTKNYVLDASNYKKEKFF